MKPTSLNLPPKFKSYRRDQFEAAVDIAATDKRFAFLNAPTGKGKSLIYMTAAKLLGGRVLVLVGTKGLQDQLTNDFAECGMFDMRGQGNYRCIALDDELADYGMAGAGCDKGPCKVGIKCDLRDNGCLYFDAQANAKTASMVVTNYAYWLSLGRYSRNPNALGEFDLVVMDEAHSAPDWLAQFCTVDLHEIEIYKVLGVQMLTLGHSISKWAKWAKDALDTVSQKSSLVQQSVGNRREKTRQLLRLKIIESNLKALSKATDDGDTQWVMEQSPKGVLFSPVWASGYAEDYLFRGAKRIVLSSATLDSKVGKYLGIKAKDIQTCEMQSDFPKYRRPIIYVPTVRMRARDKMMEGEVRQWLNRIDRIVEGRLDRKGIIHTISYARAKEIMERSKYSQHMVSHRPRDVQRVIREFKRAKAPRILVSPVLAEGFDFPGLECSYQIIAKLPFMDMRSPLMKARKASDKGYSDYLTAQALIQTSGRPMRSKTDSAETFIIDDHWKWLRKKKLFPKWFREAWLWSDTIPDAPSI